MVVFGQKLLYSVKICCIRAKWLYFGKKGCIRAKWLYSGKVVVFGHLGCIWAKANVFVQNGFVRAKVDVFEQKCCIQAKWLYSGRGDRIRAK